MRIIPSKDVPPPDPFAAQGLLGPFLPQPPGLVLLSGEASAGKTVLSYNIAYHIAEGREFIGRTPTASLSVLYVDLESPDQVHSRMVEAIGRSDNLAFGRDMTGRLYTSEGQKELTDAIEQRDARVVFIDPLSVAWPVRDENDNAEADRQMWRIKEIAVATGTLIIALWNMGEGYVKEKFRARGATARLDRVDLALNYAEVSDTRRKLTIVKSRYGNLKESITVEFTGDFGFKALAGVDVSPPSQTQVIEAHIMTLVTERPYSRQELLAALRKMEFTNDNLVDKALGTLKITGKVTSPKRGVYALPESSDS